MIHSGFIVFVACWKWAAFAEDCVPAENTWNNFNVLKPAHKKVPKWVNFDIVDRPMDKLPERLRLQGRSYAGRSEFPWLVDLREGPNPETWANGNLVSGWYVLTTCDAVVDWKRASLAEGFAFDKSSGTSNYYMQIKNASKWVVMYAADYPYITTFGREDEVGTRAIKAFHVHPKCNYFGLDYSLAVAEVAGNHPIYPFPPYTSYMDMDGNCDAFQQLKIKYNAINDAIVRDSPENTCYVGVWGRWIFGDVSHFTTSQPDGSYEQYFLTLNHKLRYAVRFVDPKMCKDLGRDIFYQRFKVQDPEYYECMGLHKNETIGVVCHHDQGAPVLCNGSVRAIVLAGANQKHCDNARPFPFIVIDARFMYSMWANIQKFVFQNVTGLKDTRGQPLSAAPPQRYSPLNTPVFIFILFVIYLYI